MAIKLSLAQLKSGPELIYDVLRTTARWELAPLGPAFRRDRSDSGTNQVDPKRCAATTA